MCQVQITKFSGCGCETYFILARCAMGDGAGNCAGQTRYERAVQEGVCGRQHCAYYANPKPRSRWAGIDSTKDNNNRLKPSYQGPGEAAIGREQPKYPRPSQYGNSRNPTSTGSHHY